MKIKHLVLGGGMLAALVLAGCAMADRKPPLKPARHVDLPRYMGPWRVIAVTDNKVEKNFTDAVETYSTPDGKNIQTKFCWRDKSLSGPVNKHEFNGKVIDRPNNAVWKMKLFPLFQASYVILAVGENYDWAVVGHPSRKFGWILARGVSIDHTTYGRCLAILRANGYDTSIFIRVPQPK